MVITHKLHPMELTASGVPQRVDVMQDDKYSRNLQISLYENGTSWKIPRNVVAVIRYKKSDGTGGNYDTLPDGSLAYSISENVLTIALAPQVCTYPGPVMLAVGLVQGDAEINTFAVHIVVQPNPGIDVVSENYSKIAGTVADSGWMPNMYLATDEDGNVVARTTDASLTMSGSVADAAAVGKQIDSLSEKHGELKGDLYYYRKDYEPYINVINASVGFKCYKLLLAGNTYVVTNKGEATLSISTETTDDTTSETIESFGNVVSNMSKEITPTQDGYFGVYANRTNTFTVECLNDIYYKFTNNKDIKDIKDVLEKCVKGGINITSTSVLDNADNAELNMMYFTSVSIENTPEEYGNLITMGADVNYCIQLFGSSEKSLYYRIKYRNWGEWVKVNGNVATNEYFDFSLVRKFGVVGDSYASGEVYWKNSDNTYSSKDKYSISWGQILARKHGNICTNYSAGGLSTRTWLTNPIGLQKMLSSEPEDIYLLALGINDYYNIGESYLGTVADIETKADTFYGNYANIIEQIKSHAPNSKIIIFTTASNESVPSMFNDAIENIAVHYGFPYIRQLDDSFFTSTVYTSMIQGHPRALGYVGMASAFDRLITKCVNKNYNYFASMFMNADD